MGDESAAGENGSTDSRARPVAGALAIAAVGSGASAGVQKHSRCGVAPDKPKFCEVPGAA